MQPERRAPARTTCPRRHSRVEAELAASRPGSVAASVRTGPPRGVSRGLNSQPLLDEPLKASSSLAGAVRTPLFALLPRGRRRRMHDLRRRWDLGSLCRALLTRGLAALGHSLKHVLGAIFSKIFGPLARYVLGESGIRAPEPGRAEPCGEGRQPRGEGKGAKFQLAGGGRALGAPEGRCAPLATLRLPPRRSAGTGSAASPLASQAAGRLVPPGELRTPGSELTRGGLRGGQSGAAESRASGRTGREPASRAGGGVRAQGTGGTSAGESPVGEAGWGCEVPRVERDARGLGPGGCELGSGATGPGGVPCGRDPATRLRRAPAGGKGQAASGKESGGGGCAAGATALSLPGRKEAGKGAAAAAAAVEYSVWRGGEKGRNGGAGGGGGAGARRARAELRD